MDIGITRCPVCTREIAIDLAELFDGGEVDICGTAIYCPACSAQYQEKRHEHN